MEAFMDTYADFLPRLSAFSVDVGYTLFKVYRAKCTHLSALLERTRQEHALVVSQQPSSSNVATSAKISSLDEDLRKTHRSMEACLLALERANNAAKVAEDGRKVADSALAAEYSKAIGLQEQLVGANAKITRLEGQISSLEISRQFDAAAKFKSEALQQANDHLSAQMMELRQKSASDLEVQASQMKVQFEHSAIDYINNAFAEAELQAEGVVFPRLPYP
ncbi:tropomyosin-like [Papaver somniferum]|uniref:tropomyosin-like n=1 Tax=Papaver somniferum TaxID=3469 RepID=UPI000E6F545E|nr:tropomyosin-like [Papaver somniferum]